MSLQEIDVVYNTEKARLTDLWAKVSNKTKNALITRGISIERKKQRIAAVNAEADVIRKALQQLEIDYQNALKSFQKIPDNPDIIPTTETPTMTTQTSSNLPIIAVGLILTAIILK